MLVQDPPPKCTRPGETVPAGDGCNTCICMEDGTLGICTIEGCVENQMITESDSNTTEGMVRMMRTVNVFYTGHLSLKI